MPGELQALGSTAQEVMRLAFFSALTTLLQAWKIAVLESRALVGKHECRTMLYTLLLTPISVLIPLLLIPAYRKSALFFF